MTQREVVMQIASKPKWYLGKMKQQTASAFLKRYNNGTVKLTTIKRVFMLFGYEGSFNDWHKQ